MALARSLITAQVWSLTLAEAEAVLHALEHGPGSAWASQLLRPYERAKQLGRRRVTFMTSLSMGAELAGALHSLDLPLSTPERRPAHGV